MKKLISYFLAVIIFMFFAINLISCNVFAEQTSTCNYLICGLDDAANNTDVIIVASILTDKNEIRLLQIPRDTAITVEDKTCKINSLVPRKLAEGDSLGEALESFKEDLSDVLGIRLDGYFAFTSEDFKDIVDSLSGIEVYIPKGIDRGVLKALGLHEGDNLLDGKNALKLIRYREGYHTADLGRIGMQKLVIGGLVKALSRVNDVGQVLDLIVGMKNLEVDYRLRDLIKTFKVIKNNENGLSLSFADLPGMAMEGANGVWYYVANRSATIGLLKEFGLLGKKEFDTENKLASKEESFSTYYNSYKTKYKIYKSNEIYSINIK